MNTPERFLLIDDDLFNNILCWSLINKVFNDVETFSFTDAQKGLNYIEVEYLKSPVPTVLFLDINMPNLTGWDVLERFKLFSDDIKQHITVFLLSSSIDLNDKERAYANPLVTDYIEKPLTKNFLQQTFPAS
jgi:response regulator RpfG family c-di-GMP phosphodiesterase